MADQSDIVTIDPTHTGAPPSWTSRVFRVVKSLGFDRWIELGLAIAIFAVTATQCSVSDAQWQAMIESNKITKAGYSAGNRSFVISDSVQIITYGAHDPDDKDGSNQIWIVTPIIENTGNSPTKFLTFSTDVKIGATPMTAEEFEKLNPYGEAFSSSTIGPKSEITGSFGFLRPPQLSQLMQRKAWVGYAGVVRYHDVFGEPHLTEFCFNTVFVPINFSSFPVGQPIKLKSVPCMRHNCSDDECGAHWKQLAGASNSSQSDH